MYPLGLGGASLPSKKNKKFSPVQKNPMIMKKKPESIMVTPLDDLPHSKERTPKRRVMSPIVIRIVPIVESMMSKKPENPVPNC